MAFVSMKYRQTLLQVSLCLGGFSRKIWYHAAFQQGFGNATWSQASLLDECVLTGLSVGLTECDITLRKGKQEPRFMCFESFSFRSTQEFI